jgi:hypothetical protein
MATLTYNKFQPFVEAVAEKKHDLGADQLVVALTNTAPNATDATLSQITEIDYTNCSARDLTTTSSSQTSGTYSLVLQDLTLTATGGSVGAFRYIVIYNDTATNDELIGYYDIGSNITLADGESYLLDFSEAQTLLTLA